MVDSAQLHKTIARLAAPDSRMTGYPGADSAARFIETSFRDIGLEDVEIETFPASVPLDEGGTLTLLDGPTGGVSLFPVYALWPNLVRTSTTPPEGITGRLIYAGTGEWTDFNDQDPEDAIVLMDFNTGVNWRNAAVLGARAVVFAEPEHTTRIEGEEKYLQVPLNLPRFWLPAVYAAPLIERLKSEKNIPATLHGRMTWKRLPAFNIMGKISGTHPQLKEETIVLNAYYDSVSPVPALSPGAGQAVGMAALLEIARYFKTNPPARTVYFLATSGHFLGLTGTANWASRHARHTAYFKNRQEKPINVSLFIGLDLSANRDQLGIYYAGRFYGGEAVEKQRFFTPFGKTFTAYGDRIAHALGYRRDMLINVITPPLGIQFTEFFPAGGIGFEPEVLKYAGYPSLTLATVFDARPLVDTPLDRVASVHIPRAIRQTRFLTGLLADAVNDVRLFPDFKIELEDRFVAGRVRVVEFDPKQSYVPNIPKPGAIVRFRRSQKSMTGVKNEILLVADSTGTVEHPMLEAGRVYDTEGFVIDEQTGDITYASDRGPYGEGSYDRQLTLDWMEKSKSTVVFRCQATNLYDLVDPRYLVRLNQAQPLDGAGNVPLTYGIVFQEGIWSTGNTYEEDTAVVFTPPGERFKLLMSQGPVGRRLTLLNASEKHPEGIGFSSDMWAIPHTSYQVARDMWHLTDARLQTLRAAGVSNLRLEAFHTEASRLIAKAEAARLALRWDVFMKYARAAWGYESRAYPDATSAAQDVMFNLLFYMVLVIPFAGAMERLAFGFSDIYRRIGATIGFFLAAYLLLRFTHPAFSISHTPDIFLLAFLMLCLAAAVIWILVRRFTGTMKTWQDAGRVHGTDVHRSAALFTAASLGIAYMRKRKARTALTCLTLVLLVFTVLSFTSVRTFMRVQKIDKPHAPVYPGFLVRNPNWAPVQKQTFEYVAAEFGSTEDEDRQTSIAPRAWYASGQAGVKTFIKVERGEHVSGDTLRSLYAGALIGLTSEEPRITGVDRALTAGRWFEKDEYGVCVISSEAADRLGIDAAQVGRAKIHILGQPFTVIALFDARRFEHTLDLDGEPLTPVDFDVTSRDLQTQLARRQEVYDNRPVETPVFVHQPTANLIVVPYEYVNDIGGTLRSVSVRFPDYEGIAERLDRFMPRLGIPVTGNADGRVAVYSALGLSSFSGVGHIAVPLLIAGLIVMNTMLNAVYDRVREIGVYGALGLAPAHIGALFLAEAGLYAVVGGMAGYLLGQTVARGLGEWALLPALALDYSSLAAAGSTFLVMAAVLLSAVYPAWKAAVMAVPDVSRQWDFPEPDGPVWRFVFPFTVPKHEAVGLCRFLYRYFETHGDETLGLFRATRLSIRRETNDGWETHRIDAHLSLAPYDLGISETIAVEAHPAGDFNTFDIHVAIRQESGDRASWLRVNRRFLNGLRRQFLIWRTLDGEIRKTYMQGE